MTDDGQNLKEQMREQMRNQFRTGGMGGNYRTMSVGREFEHGYRNGYREGYEQAMRDDHDTEMQRHTAFSNESREGGKYSM